MVQKTSRWLRELVLIIGIRGASHKLNDLSSLSLCTRLSSLDISRHRGISSLAPLSTLTGLRELRAHNTSVSSIEPLRSCSQITCLVISRTDISCLEPLRSLSELQKLDLEHCNVLISLEPLSSLSQLLDLNLHACSNLPPSALTPLSSCTALRILDIRCCNFDLAPLASCRDLRRLFVYRMYVQTDISPLHGMSGLQVKVDINRYE